MVILTLKYEIKGKRSKRILRRHAWGTNCVWNFCVQSQRKVQRNHREGLKATWPSDFTLMQLTAGTSKTLGIHAQTVQNVCKQFIQSRDQHGKCPRFRKSSGSRKALGWIPFQARSRQLGENSVTYLGHKFSFFGAKRRPLPETVKDGCFVEDARGRWYVCLRVEVPDEPRASEGAVGIDLGLHALMTLSTGEKIDAPKIGRRYAEKLAVAQRAGNKQLAKAINAKIKNSRQDFWHKETTKLTRRFETIYVGDVSVSALGKTKMAKSIYDAGLSIGKEMLRYKASRHGGSRLIVKESFTTQTCHSCGEIPPSSPKGIAGLGIREWVCSLCGACHDRDVNAARNILKLGLSAQPPVEESRAAYGR